MERFLCFAHVHAPELQEHAIIHGHELGTFVFAHEAEHNIIHHTERHGLVGRQIAIFVSELFNFGLGGFKIS
jgi:hypothetical protein